MAELAGFAARHRRPLGLAVVLCLLGLGFAALAALTRELNFAEVRAAVHALSARQVASALALTAASYLALTGYDVLALRVLGRPLPWRTAALASFVSYTLSHNLGLSLLTGGSARYHIYSAAGLDGVEIAQVIGVASVTFWSGVLTVAGAALLLHAGPVALPGLTLGVPLSRAIGGAVLAMAVALLAVCHRARRPTMMFGRRVPLPTARQALAQIAIASVDITMASAALFVLLPDAAPGLLPTFMLGYALGLVAAVVTHVPGGIGVFEATVLAIVPVDRTALFAALIAYRLVYYLLPLVAGVVLLAWREGARRRAAFGLLRGTRTLARGVAPALLSALAFLGGAMLLLSGSLPAIHARMGWLTSLVPLPFVEASHTLASLVGTALLLLSPFLYRRLDGAFVATRALLVVGAVFSLTKGADYEEAIACLAIAGLLQWTRPAFYRRTALTGRVFSPAWLASVAAVLGASAWAGFFAYRHVGYSGDLWWQFAADADAPRFLRALLATTVLVTGVAVWRLMAPAEAAAAPGADDPATVRPLLARATRTEALLALTGDKRFLLASRGDAFLMYQVKGASWIVMGDPVGARASWGELLWRLRDLADRAQGRLVLYQITPATLELAIGMGLSVVKYGEEAIVPLARFALDTPRLRTLRKAERAVARKGLRFAVVPAAEVDAIMPELAAVSDRWLAAKGGREKGFSLGAFDPHYLRQFDMAVARQEGRIVAFANLWGTADRTEGSVDLMRHTPDAPAGTMDFLFVHCLTWMREQGFARFSLGMAPLAGLENRRLAPAWSRAGAFIFRHGERLYGFKGLRAYKEKFAPDWEPRYIAGPHGLAMVQGLRDLSRLIGRPVAAARRRPARTVGLPPQAVGARAPALAAA